MAHNRRMERFAGWLWDRYRARFDVALAAVGLLIVLGVICVPSMIAVSSLLDLRPRVVGGYAAIITSACLLALFFVFVWLGRETFAHLRAWGSGDRSEPQAALEATYGWRRVAIAYGGTAGLAMMPALLTLLAVMTDLSSVALWATALGMGLTVLIGITVVAVGYDVLLRPMRKELDSELAMDESVMVRPEWSISSRLGQMYAAMGWAIGMLAAAVVVRFDDVADRYAAAVLASLAFVVLFGMVGWMFGLGPVLRPVGDLLSGTERVARGDFAKRLPVTSNDELGRLVSSFNRMQTGLLERERLHSAFGSYVDPALAARLLAQGDDLFEGEQVDVTVFFADVRGFTTYAEAHTPDESVARLNELFSIVVPILIRHGGHANKFLGDGVLAVFGVPALVPDHADHALAAAVEILRDVRTHFRDELRIGIGVNTGPVIAGTIGGGGKLEFTLIGDTVNAAARIEELTKTTGDALLLAETTKDALNEIPAGLASRGTHELRGKSHPTTLFALDDSSSA